MMLFHTFRAVFLVAFLSHYFAPAEMLVDFVGPANKNRGFLTTHGTSNVRENVRNNDIKKLAKKTQTN